MTDVQCPNCGGTMDGSPCSGCGYRRRKPALYPIGHDRLTDSYIEPASQSSGQGASQSDRTPTESRTPRSALTAGRSDAAGA